jgi:hypothetical protein
VLVGRGPAEEARVPYLDSREVGLRDPVMQNASATGIEGRHLHVGGGLSPLVELRDREADAQRWEGVKL